MGNEHRQGLFFAYHLSVHATVSLFVHALAYLSVHVSVYLLTYLFICSFVRFFFFSLADGNALCLTSTHSTFECA